MRKLLVYVIAIIMLTGCVTTPDTTSIQATVESAVNTAIAPYESKYSNFITAEDLAASQNEQNRQIQLVINQPSEEEDNALLEGEDNEARVR